MILIGYFINRQIVLSIVLGVIVWLVLFVIRRNYLGLDSFANYWTKSPVMGIGSLFTGASLLVFNSQILISY